LCLHLLLKSLNNYLLHVTFGLPQDLMPSISGLNDFEPYNITLIEAVNMAQNSTLSGAGQNDDDDDFIIHSPFQSHSHSLLKMTVPSQLIMTQHS